MKFPRWLVIAMLTTSVLAVLAAAGWWWITWPERTARTFLSLIVDGRFEDARRLCSPRALEYVEQVAEYVRTGTDEVAESYRNGDSGAEDLRREVEHAFVEWKANWQSARLDDRTMADVFYGRVVLRSSSLHPVTCFVHRGRVVEALPFGPGRP